MARAVYSGLPIGNSGFSGGNTEWRGEAWPAKARHGLARPGKARAVYSGLPIGNSGFSGGNTKRHGLAGQGLARRGEAWLGKARAGNSGKGMAFTSVATLI